MERDTALCINLSLNGHSFALHTHDSWEHVSTPDWNDHMMARGAWRRVCTSRNGAVVKGETASTDMKPSTILNQSGLTANPQGPGCTPPPSHASHLVTKCTCRANYWKYQGSVSWLDDLHNKKVPEVSIQWQGTHDLWPYQIRLTVPEYLRFGKMKPPPQRPTTVNQADSISSSVYTRSCVFHPADEPCTDSTVYSILQYQLSPHWLESEQRMLLTSIHTGSHIADVSKMVRTQPGRQCVATSRARTPLHFLFPQTLPQEVIHRMP